MTPIEKTLYGRTRFQMDDDVSVAGEFTGTITGIKVISSGEDEYRVFYFDLCGNPQERWWRDSVLDDAEQEPDNVVQFPCACERADIAAARNATKH